MRRLYKDRLIGEIPGAYVQSFDLEADPVLDSFLDNETDKIIKGFVAVKLSQDVKHLIRGQWSKALIVKVFGRTVRFHFLLNRKNSLRKPSERMDCVDLGRDYFLIKFSSKEDFDKVLKGGSWFMGEHFLAIRKWELNFRPSIASFSSVAVWVRLLELPMKYYIAPALKEIGEVIGPILRVDANIASGLRGRYVRICVSLTLGSPSLIHYSLGALLSR